MSSTLILDEISGIVTVDGALTLQRVESFLNRKGFTLAYEPVPAKSGKSISGGQTIAGFLQARWPNRLASRYGEIDDICVSIRLEPTQARSGHRSLPIETKRVPRAATGPDLKKIILGSGGAFGRIVRASLRVVRRPQAAHSVRVQWKNRAAFRRFLTSLAASGIRPLVQKSGGLALTIRIEGDKEIVDAEEETLKRLIQSTGGRMGKE